MRLTPPEGAPLSQIASYIGYPLGKVMLRILTLGRYPPENSKHNSVFVSLFPWFAIIIGFLILDEWPTLRPLFFGD